MNKEKRQQIESEASKAMQTTVTHLTKAKK